MGGEAVSLSIANCLCCCHFNVLIQLIGSLSLSLTLCVVWGESDRLLLGADDVRGPVAPAADGVEGEVRGALVDPAGDALARRPRAAHHELAARVRVREHADVEALHLAVRKDVHLESMQETIKLSLSFVI